MTIIYSKMYITNGITIKVHEMVSCYNMYRANMFLNMKGRYIKYCTSATY